MKSPVWISYDLSVRGDYEGMYAWLDKHKAKECGDSLAFLLYEYKRDLVREVTADLKDAITMTKRTRIYMIFFEAQKKIIGKWLYGGRKAPPWAGFAGGIQEEDEDKG